jgi:hypothetical protein
LHKQSVIESEEQKESPSSHPIVDESIARPGKKYGPQWGVIETENQAMKQLGVIRTEDQIMRPRGVIEMEDHAKVLNKAKAAKLLQSKVGNQRTGKAMGAKFGEIDKDFGKPTPIATSD